MKNKGLFGKLYSRRLFLSLVCPGKKRDLQEAGQHLPPPLGLSSPSHTHFSFYYCLLMRLFILPAVFWLYNAFFNPAQCVRKWLRRGGAFHQVFEDLQEFMHQSGLCQREDDFCFCKGMASFQGGSSKSCRRTGLGEEGGMILFQKEGTVPLHKFRAETSKQGTSTGQRPLAEPLSLPTESLFCDPSLFSPYRLWLGIGKALSLWLSSV